jgi:hypothetical protein
MVLSKRDSGIIILVANDFIAEIRFACLFSLSAGVLLMLS